MIALRLHHHWPYRRQRRRSIEVLDATPPPTVVVASSAIAGALPPPRLPRRPAWAGPAAVAAMTARWLHELARPRASDNRLAAYLDRRLRRATDKVGELDRIRRELAEIRGPLDRLPAFVDAEVHVGGAEWVEDYQPLRAIAARARTGGEAP